MSTLVCNSSLLFAKLRTSSNILHSSDFSTFLRNIVAEFFLVLYLVRWFIDLYLFDGCVVLCCMSNLLVAWLFIICRNFEQSLMLY